MMNNGLKSLTLVKTLMIFNIISCEYTILSTFFEDLLYNVKSTIFYYII